MMLDVLIFLLPVAGIAFGWTARADKADRDAQNAYDRGYQDAVRQYGR
jgi:lipopolysaccharide biosynthesis regulator YciM